MIPGFKFALEHVLDMRHIFSLISFKLLLYNNEVCNARRGHAPFGHGHTEVYRLREKALKTFGHGEVPPHRKFWNRSNHHGIANALNGSCFLVLGHEFKLIGKSLHLKPKISHNLVDSHLSNIQASFLK